MTEGTWPENDIRRAFVAGASWWEYYSTHFTMWQSDRRLAEEEAQKRYGDEMTHPIENIANLIIKEATNRITGNENLVRGIHLVHYQVNLRLLAVIKEEERKVEITARLKKEIIEKENL